MRHHVQEQHRDFSNQANVETLVDMSERRKPLGAASECPLCHAELASMDEYARHVGRHQKDLALFALPKLDVESDEEQDRIKEGGSTDSGYTEVGVNNEALSCTRRELDWTGVANIAQTNRPRRNKRIIFFPILTRIYMSATISQMPTSTSPTSNSSFNNNRTNNCSGANLFIAAWSRARSCCS